MLATNVTCMGQSACLGFFHSITVNSYASFFNCTPVVRASYSVMVRDLKLFIYPLVTNGISHPYQLGESTLFIGALGVILIFISFFDESRLSKQKCPRWDAAFCGVTPGAILFAYVPQKRRHAHMV